MSIKDKLKATKDKVSGSIKEGAGKLMEDEQVELEGKLEKGKGEAREKLEETKDTVKEKFEKGKEKASSKINEAIDKVKGDK